MAAALAHPRPAASDPRPNLVLAIARLAAFLLPIFAALRGPDPRIARIQAILADLQALTALLPDAERPNSPTPSPTHQPPPAIHSESQTSIHPQRPTPTPEPHLRL